MLLDSEVIWQKIEKLDQWAFLQINNNLSHPFLDEFMPLFRNSFFWIPLYFFLLLFATINFKNKGWWWLLFFICTVSLTDLISSRLIKESFERLRPCMDPEFSLQVRLLLNRCSGGYSFTSSHAANHFGIAAYFFVTTKFLLNKWAWLAFGWAAIICFAQIYVGVHYPLDIIGGAIVGLTIGLTIGSYFKKRY